MFNQNDVNNRQEGREGRQVRVEGAIAAEGARKPDDRETTGLP